LELKPSELPLINEIERKDNKQEMRRALICASSHYRSFDIELLVDEGRVIPAHRAILCARSEYFRAMFLGPLKEGNLKSVAIPNVAHLVLLAIQEYCYTDDVKYPDNRWVVDLMLTANMFGLDRLNDILAKKIQHDITIENAITLFKTGEQIGCVSLKEASLYVILCNFNIIKKKVDFRSLSVSDQEFLKNERSKYASDKEIEDYFKALSELENDTPNNKKCLLQ